MRVAILSDIHGNAFAFETVIADLQRAPVDHVVCLGDAIQGGAQPAQVVAQLRALACPVVMGNADAWLLSGVETSDEGIPEPRATQLRVVRDWSLAQLSDDDQLFIAAFQPTVELAQEGGHALLCFHGSPASFDDIFLPTTAEDEFQTRLAPYLPKLMCGGHTHVQYVRRVGTRGSFFFNPGSVGFAYGHYLPDGNFRTDAWAEYAILTSEHDRLALEFRRLPYDADALIAIYRASGRPYADEAIAQYGG